MAVTMVLNLVLIIYAYLLGNYYSTQVLKAELAELAKREEPISINFEEFNVSNKLRFAENRVEFKAVKNYIDKTGQEVTMLCDITYRYFRYEHINAGKTQVFKILGVN